MVSLPKDFLRTQEGQRVERRDFEHAIFTTPRSILESIVNDLIIGQATPGNNIPSNYVISGFPVTANGTPSGSAPTITYTTSGIVTVTRGSAIVGTRIDGQVEFGLTLANGELTRSQDISSLADGTYGVYVRLEFRDSVFQNRIFWNPLAATPVETTQNMATRRAENWAMAIEAVSPGSEWMLLAEVVKTGTTLAITDRRTMFFDDSTSTGASLTDSDWGGGTDRDNNRRLNGVQGLFQSLVAIRRQLQDIIGAGNWFDTVPLSLTALPNTFLARDGSNTMNTGTQINWVDDTGVIGGSQAVDRVQARLFNGANQFSTNVGAAREVLNGAFSDNQQADPDRALMALFQGFNDVGGGIYSATANEGIRIYAAGDGVNGNSDYMEIALNAVFDPATATWSRGWNTGRASALIRMGPATSGGTQSIFEIDYRPASLSDTWNDTTTPSTGWTRLWYVGPTTHTSMYGAADVTLGFTPSAADLIIPQQTSPESGAFAVSAQNTAGVKEFFISLADIPDGATITGANAYLSPVTGNVRMAIVRRITLGGTVGQSFKTGTPYDVINSGGAHGFTLDETVDVRTLNRGTYTYYAWFQVETSVSASFYGLEVDWQNGVA